MLDWTFLVQGIRTEGRSECLGNEQNTLDL